MLHVPFAVVVVVFFFFLGGGRGREGVASYSPVERKVFKVIGKPSHKCMY